jgi:pseudouridine-5'-phosphate glycosidase
MTLPLRVAPEVADALATDGAVVALETTAIAHGLPFPANLELARRQQAAIRERGGVPAVIGLWEGSVRIGLDDALLETFARGQDFAKVSRRDLAAVLAKGAPGATTVAGTMICAAAAGIRLSATGGIGGVHRGGEQSFDISADLPELGRTPVAVVSAGAKAILDLPRTLEVLETHGVPVIGWKTDDFPAFYTRHSGLPVVARVDSAPEAAALLRVQWEGGLGGVLIANPVPQAAALDERQVEAWIEEALAEAAALGIAGKEVTPFLLHHLAEVSEGATSRCNEALLEHNAEVAAEIAVALAKLR